MINPNTHFDSLQRHAISGHVSIGPGNGGLVKISIESDHSTAEIYPHGAHVTGFQKKGEAPLLFISQSSQFAEDKAIRGGVPIVFPWFGPHEGAPAHGFGRLAQWDLCETRVMPEGGVQLRFELPQPTLKHHGLNIRVHYLVTVGQTLTMEFSVANASSDAAFTFESCLHTYFTVGDIHEVSITGVKGVEYLDKVGGGDRKREIADAIRISSEVDRVYLNTAAAVEIQDDKLRRLTRVEKSGSTSTVVWNPWTAKSVAMSDFGNEEYQRMVCVESGNVADNQITLEPGHSQTLKVILSSRPI